jgi:hypothetical protein
LAQASGEGLGAVEGAVADGAAADAAVLADGLAPAVVQPPTASATSRTTDDVSALRMLESPLVLDVPAECTRKTRVIRSEITPDGS